MLSICVVNKHNMYIQTEKAKYHVHWKKAAMDSFKLNSTE